MHDSKERYELAQKRLDKLKQKIQFLSDELKSVNKEALVIAIELQELDNNRPRIQ